MFIVQHPPTSSAVRRAELNLQVLVSTFRPSNCAGIHRVLAITSTPESEFTQLVILLRNLVTRYESVLPSVYATLSFG